MHVAERPVRSGKVRELYDLGDGRVVLVASDRISAFDVVLPTVIPDKGRVLTGMSRYWFEQTPNVVPNHLLGADPAILGGDETAIRHRRGRVMVCRAATVVAIEAVVRGYLAGSGWGEYRERGSVAAIPLPRGLREGDRLPEPIFAPATKAPAGEHDQNITFDEMVARVGGEVAEAVRERSLELYRFGSDRAAEVGIIVADTKFEFGLVGAELLLIDEILTPDSSRFWDAATYRPGGSPPSFDKQFVRDWLSSQAWDRTDPGPALPQEVMAGTRARYIEAFERITGGSFDRYLHEDVIAP